MPENFTNDPDSLHWYDRTFVRYTGRALSYLAIGAGGYFLGKWRQRRIAKAAMPTALPSTPQVEMPLHIVQGS